MNNDNKPSFLRVGTPACGAFMALLGAVLALLLVYIGFWRTLVDEKMPHSDFLVQEDRVVFEQLSLTSPLLGFVTNAAYLAGEMPGRTVVPLEDSEAHVRFYLLAHQEASAHATELFDWVAAQNRPDPTS